MIDIHTHFFPDAIADMAVRKLAAAAGIPCFGNGTLASLRAAMRAADVATSVNQPVATSPEQVRSINRKMAALNAERTGVISFGGMHPAFAGLDEELDFLAAGGFRGIKLHPDYQEFHPDDERLLPLYEGCRRRGLAILFHAGVDLAFPYVHGTPRRFAQVLQISGLTVILAHMGGYRMWDEVEKYIVGKDVYLDTSFSHELPGEQMRALVQAHRADRILFGSDHPWWDAGRTRATLDRLGLAPDLTTKILTENAAALLRL
jgi:predicted TIM-barrel fold metal-dependent hydrolase